VVFNITKVGTLVRNITYPNGEDAMPSDKANSSENTRSHRHIDDPDSSFKGSHKLQPSNFDQGNYTITDSIDSQNDVDIWRVHLNAGETLSVATDTPNGGYTPDTVLSLFDNKGTLLFVNDDDDSGVGFGSFLEYEATSSGNYFVAVSSNPNFATGGGDFAHGGPEYELGSGSGISTGSYTLNFDILA
jgi:hypothetical protein